MLVRSRACPKKQDEEGCLLAGESVTTGQCVTGILLSRTLCCRDSKAQQFLLLCAPVLIFFQLL